MRLPVGAHGVQLGPQAFKVIGQPFGQAGVGLHREAEANKTARADVKGIAGRQVPAAGIAAAVKRGPGDVGAQRRGGRGAITLGVAAAGRDGAVGLAAHVGREHYVGQVQAAQHIGAVAHVGGADVKAYVGRVNVGQALQTHAVGGRVARADAARAANADGDVGLDGALNQVAVGLGHALAVGVDDAHVIQTQRHVAQVKNGADVRGVQHLPALGFDLELAGPAQLDQRARRKAGTFNVHRDPAVRIVAGAALVGRDAGDGQRQQIGAHGGGGGRVKLAPAHQHVIIPRLGAGDQHLLVGRHGVAVGRVKRVAVGDVAPADVELGGAGVGSRVHLDAQRLAGGHADLVKPHRAGG